MQQLEDEDELAYSAEETSGISDGEKYEDGRPSWMKTLHNSATTWLQLLPKSLQVSKVVDTGMKREIDCDEFDRFRRWNEPPRILKIRCTDISSARWTLARNC